MDTEMDITGMDERQRLAWLQANRITLMMVGLTWIGMILYELFNSGFPTFLVVMVPVFAFIRFLTYRFYQRAKK